MKLLSNRISLIAFFILVTFSVNATFAQQFKVMLDAGHGGKDFGASRGKYIEKHIALDVTLRVGKLLSKHKDVKVLYTRTKDVFVKLRNRSKIANDANADVFVSIHANAVNRTGPYGFETFVMGLNKNKSNLEVAKRENGVIVLEKNHKTAYAGYNPSDPSSLIGLTLVQEQYLNQSINLASKIQSGVVYGLGRNNRGVKQAPFWVLHGAFMPSVLVELGFLSNKKEGAYVNSEKGRVEMSKAIAKAIIDYKNQYYSESIVSATKSKTKIKRTTASKTKVKSKVKSKVKLKDRKLDKHNTKAKRSSIVIDKVERVTKKGVIFRVQIAASKYKRSVTSSNFKGLKNIEVIKEGKLYKYYYNKTTDINRVRKALENAKDVGYTDAYIVPFKNGKKTSLIKVL